MTETNGARPLSDLPAGTEGIIRALMGGREFRSRVANLGFTAGATVKVMQNYGHGPMLVSIRGTLVALGRHEAAKVWVDSAETVSHQ
ncbi:MAG: FeoA family protein [Anaerolineae bacterium]